MKLIRIGPRNYEKPGIFTSEGTRKASVRIA